MLAVKTRKHCLHVFSRAYLCLLYAYRVYRTYLCLLMPTFVFISYCAYHAPLVTQYKQLLRNDFLFFHVLIKKNKKINKINKIKKNKKIRKIKKNNKINKE